MDSLIIDHKLKDYFKKLVKNRLLAHSYIFSGRDMIGKKSFALSVYQLTNNKDNILSGDGDIKVIVGEKEGKTAKITIEKIRELKSFMSLKSASGLYKFAVIDDAHNLTTEAANALLKILEEPPAFSVLILVTSMVRSLPDTIRSRCEIINFKLPDSSEIKNFISKLKVSKDDAEFIYKISGGRVGLAYNLVNSDDLEVSKKRIDDLRKVFKSGLADRLNYAKKVSENDEINETVNDWLAWLYAHRSNFPNYPILKKILNLNQILSRPGLNQRLALENFLISL